MKLRDGWRVLQEVLCSPEDILGTHPECDGEPSIVPLARTVTALLTHATPPAPPKDMHTDPHCHTTDPPEQYHSEYYATENADTSLEVNYYQRQLRKYSEERFNSNFNTLSENNQHYTIDESEEYQLNCENNNTDTSLSVHYSPVYGTSELRNRGPYFQKNRVQFVTPICKEHHILTNENFEIYDTDEVDFPLEMGQEEDLERYDRGKMNLDLENNLNSVIATEAAAIKDEDRVFYTCLCLGTFIVSTILLIIYPL